MSNANKLLMAASGSAGGGGEPVAEGVSFDGVSDFLNGQSFVGTNLEFDVYYVSGTMPFGVPVTAKNTWIRVSVSGSYTVENIGLNFKGRLANITLDSSVDMPMKDADTAGVNLGTGGDFVVNGVLDDAQRGPNQNNCVASEFDGSNDYLSRSSVTAPDGKQFTFSCIFESDNFSGDYIFGLSRLSVNLNSGRIQIAAVGVGGGSNVVRFYYTLPSQSTNISYSVSCSVDVSATTVINMFVNGVDVSGDIVIQDDFNADIEFSDTSALTYVGSYFSTGNVFNGGTLGELYFDTTYTDLSADNPFWDYNTNKPKPIRQVLEETGNTPLIAMPISADNPGKNYGTSGDFTVNG